MKRKDLILALLIVIVWGANFTVIRLGLNGVPSMLLVAFRYILVAFPAIFFVKKPKNHLKYILAYGFSVGVGQFGCLFYAIQIGMPAGIASILTQLQAFITPLLAFVFFKESIKPKQVIGFLIAALGLSLIGIASVSNGIASIPLGAILLNILTPVFWSTSNIVLRHASNKATEEGHKLDMLSMVVWSALVPPIPMIGLSLLVDKPETIINSLMNLNVTSVFSALYLGYASTLFAYGVWSTLLSKYPLSKVSPISLMVPITGLLTARIVLSEQLSLAQWMGVIIILTGLIIANIDFRQLSHISNRNVARKDL